MPFNPSTAKIEVPTAGTPGQPKRFNPTTAKPAAEQPVGYGEDILRSAPGALRQGFESIPGGPGDLAAAASSNTGSVFNKIATWLGMDPKKADTYSKVISGVGPSLLSPAAPFSLLEDKPIPPMPTTGDIHGATSKVLGEDYQPKTAPGKLASGVIRQAPALLNPGSLAMKTTQAVGSGLLSEGAGMAGEAMGAEPGGFLDSTLRLGGNVAGGFTPSAWNRLSRPRPIGPERRANLDVFEREGIPSTAGQQTGDRRLQFAEERAGGQRVVEQQKDQFSRAALGRTGASIPPGTVRASQGVIDNALNHFDTEFNRLAGGTSAMMDTQLQNDMLNTAVSYIDETPLAAPFVENFVNDLAQKAAGNGGMVSGEVYRNARTKLGSIIRNGDPGLRGPAIDLQEALDDAVGRSMGPQQMAEWDAARQDYRNFLPVEYTVSGAGADASRGVVTPQGLRTGVRASQGRRALASGRNAFGDLIEAGNDIMVPLPSSGTAERGRAMMPGIAGLTTIAGIMSDKPLTGIGTGLAAMALPRARDAAMMSAPGQAFLARQGPVINTNRQGLAQVINATREAQMQQALREKRR